MHSDTLHTRTHTSYAHTNASMQACKRNSTMITHATCSLRSVQSKAGSVWIIHNR